MKTAAIEVSIFKAVAKAIGVYHLVLGAASLYRLILATVGIAFPGGADWQQHAAWVIFEFAVGVALLFRTDTFCRLAFRPDALADTPSMSP